MKAQTLLNKAYTAENKLNSACSDLLDEIKKHIDFNDNKSMDEEDLNEFLFDLGCEYQPSDGFIINTRANNWNVGITSLIETIKTKGKISYQDFQDSRI